MKIAGAWTGQTLEEFALLMSHLHASSSRISNLVLTSASNVGANVGVWQLASSLSNSFIKWPSLFAVLVSGE